MSEKSQMIVVSLGAWIFAALSIALLPVANAVPVLKSAGGSVPVIAALSVGALIGVPLAVLMRRLCGFEAPDKNVWGVLSKREAKIFGVISWGLPVGLIFVLNEFLQSRDPFAIVPALIIWPITGMAFGAMMRWLAIRRHNRETPLA